MKTSKGLTTGIIFFTLAMLFTTSAQAYTAVVSGSWSSATTWGGVAPGSAVSNQDIVIPAGVTVTLDVDVSFTGVLNTFAVNGTLNTSTGNSLSLFMGSLSGTGTVNIHTISFSGLLASSTYAGTLIVDELNTSGAPLVFLGAVTVADTLNVNSAIALNAGAVLTMSTNSTIIINNGALSIGGGIFNSGNDYSVIYKGVSKTSSIELNTSTLQNLNVQLADSAQTLTLAANLAVNGQLALLSGKLDFSDHSLSIHGNLINGSGAHLVSNTNSNLLMQGVTPPVQGLAFVAGSTLNNFTINYTDTGSAKLNSAVAVSGMLALNSGDLSLESGSTLTMNAGSEIRVQSGTLTADAGTFVGSAGYSVEYTGSNYTTGVELSGSGLTSALVTLSSGTAQLKLGSDVVIQNGIAILNGKLSLNGNDLEVNGDWEHSATANFIGDATSDLTLNLTSSTNDTLYFDTINQSISHLTVNMESGANIVLGNSLTVFDELKLQSGSVDIANNDLLIEGAASINNYSDSNYIVTSGSGTLQMQVNAASTYVVFPIGTAADYSPAAVQQASAGTSGFFNVRAMDGVYADGTTGVDLTGISALVDRTWLISADSGVAVNSNIRLGWKAAAEVNGFDRTQAFISHYVAAMWDAYPVAAASAGANGTFEIERSGITSLSPFTVADVTFPVGVDELKPAASLHVYPNPVTDFVSLEMGNSTGKFKYDVVDITGKILMSIDNQHQLNLFDVSKLNGGFYFIRATRLDNKETITKSFIKS